MSKSFRPGNVDQVWLLPPAIDDLVPAGHMAHLVRDLVRETLDLTDVMAASDEPRGYPPYHPAMMVAILLHAYSQGVYSSRRIARALEERLDFMAVSTLQRPDFRTISDFRKRHLGALAGLFGQALGLCREAGLVELGHVALGGTKLKANRQQAQGDVLRPDGRAEGELRAEIEAWLAKAEAVDAAKDAEHGDERRGDEMPDRVQDKHRRLETIRAAKAALEAKARARGQRQGCGQEQRGRAARAQGRSRAAEAVGAAQFHRPREPDHEGQGRCAGRQRPARGRRQGADQRRLRPHGQSGRRRPAGAAPGPDRGPPGAAPEGGLGRRRLLLRNRPPGARRTLDQGLSRHRTAPPSGAVPWSKLRKQTVEPVFGQIKQARGFRQFLLRGLTKVQAEWALTCTAHTTLKLLKARPA